MAELISRDFKGIWIPKKIWLHPTLSWAAKGLWAEIDSLYCEEKGGCYASDEYLEEFLGVKRTRLHEVLKELTDNRLLEKVSSDGRGVIRKALQPEEDGGHQMSGKADIRNPENRTSQCRKSGQLSYIENKAKSKEQQQQAAVVVPSNQESLDLLKQAGFDDKTAASLAKFPKNRILRQTRNLKESQEIMEIDNPLGWLRSAIENDWNLPEPKEDFAEKAAILRRSQLEERTAIKKECEKLYDQYENLFQVNKYFDIGIDVMSCKNGDKHFHCPYDENCLKILKKFIKESFE